MSRDTLDTAIAAAAFVRQHLLAGCIPCSDRYHLLRIKLLLSVLGVPTISGSPDPARSGTPLGHLIKMQAREAVALPYDLALVLARRSSILGELDNRRGGDG